MIANDALVCHILVDAELLVDRKNAAEIEVNRVVQHARQCVPAQHNALFVFESALTRRLLNLQEEEQRFGLALVRLRKILTTDWAVLCARCLTVRRVKLKDCI